MDNQANKAPDPCLLCGDDAVHYHSDGRVISRKPVNPEYSFHTLFDAVFRCFSIPKTSVARQDWGISSTPEPFPFCQQCETHIVNLIDSYSQVEQMENLLRSKRVSKGHPNYSLISNFDNRYENFVEAVNPEASNYIDCTINHYEELTNQLEEDSSRSPKRRRRDTDESKPSSENLVEAQLAKTLLPIEMWSEILSKLSTPKDILNTRAVCTEFNKEVEKQIEKWIPLNNECDTLAHFSPSRYQNCVTHLTKIQSSADQFFVQMETHDGNPFPTGWVSIHPLHKGYRFDNENYDNGFSNFAQLSSRFGTYVRRLYYTIVGPWSIAHLRFNLFQNFSNLSQLELVIRLQKIPDKEIESRLKWIKTFHFPPLPHLQFLRIHFHEVFSEKLILPYILRAYGSQIKTLDVKLSTDGHCLNHEDLPNLINLQIELWAEPENRQYVLNFLRQGNWPLKQLTIAERDGRYWGGYKFKDLTSVINKYAATLEILHLYVQSYTARDMILVSKSKSMTEIVNMNISLPRVREFGVTINWLHTGIPAIISLCEKMTNLRTLHVCDWKLEHEQFEEDRFNHEEHFNTNWWPKLSPSSKLERIIVFGGNGFKRNVVFHKVIPRL